MQIQKTVKPLDETVIKKSIKKVEWPTDKSKTLKLLYLQSKNKKQGVQGLKDGWRSDSDTKGETKSSNYLR